jgi:hypothetical protein
MKTRSRTKNVHRYQVGDRVIWRTNGLERRAIVLEQQGLPHDDPWVLLEIPGDEDCSTRLLPVPESELRPDEEADAHPVTVRGRVCEECGW